MTRLERVQEPQVSKLNEPRNSKATWQNQLLATSWLLIPIAIAGGVAVVGVTNQKPDAPKASQMSQVIQPPSQVSGKDEFFTVKTPGSPLPPQPADTQLPGTPIPRLGQDHVPETERVKYNSNPPTSGPHFARWAQWGIHRQAPVDEQLVHNLEHGGVIISYRPEQIAGQQLEQLKAQVRELGKINPRIILTPRSKMETAIALTAWGYLQKLDGYDPKAVRAFYDAHIARGPECQNGLCPD